MSRCPDVPMSRLFSPSPHYIELATSHAAPLGTLPEARWSGRPYRGAHGRMPTKAHAQETDMRGSYEPERVETIIIGAGQAGLSVGYHLARRGRQFLILEANERVGDSWRMRWDSLRLFTPARYDALDGHAVPVDSGLLPDEGRDGRLPRLVCVAFPAARSHGTDGHEPDA